ncbi:MAG: acyl-CoA thioesterase [Aeromicrobium sp.]|nr:acyl-CoA thioesterase [Aeromicrobium sp.]
MSEPLQSLLAMLDLDEVEQTEGTSRGSLDGSGVTELEGPCDDFGNEHMVGGHVMAQALVAAGRTVTVLPGAPRRPHSLHAYFLRPGDVHVPIRFVVEHLRDGGSFSQRAVHALQHGKRIFTANASFHSGVDGVEHQDEAPEVAGPDGYPTLGERYAEAAIALGRQVPPSPAWGAIEERLISPDVYLAAPETRSPDQVSWLRTTGSMPDDPLLQAAVLVNACDLSLLMPAVRRHGLHVADSRLGLATVDYTMWFHRPVRMDEWVLSHLHTPTAQGGRVLVAGQLFQDGVLVASVAREGKIDVRTA